LENTIFDAIYYFLLIYCIAMSCVEWLLVHGTSDIVHFNGCIHVCYLWRWSYVLMYKCTHMSGGLHKVVNVGLTWRKVGEWQKHVPKFELNTYRG
jgi:hypothetical protein